MAFLRSLWLTHSDRPVGPRVHTSRGQSPSSCFTQTRFAWKRRSRSRRRWWKCEEGLGMDSRPDSQSEFRPFSFWSHDPGPCSLQMLLF